MAKAKLKKVRSQMTGKTINVECPGCYDEFGSESCLRPAHGTFAHIENTVKDVEEAVKAATKLVKVTQDEQKPVEKEVLATAIVSISDAVKKLYDSGLNRRAVVALLADSTKLGKGTIETVLDSLLDLRKTYTK
jgi:hypothetical protein